MSMCLAFGAAFELPVMVLVLVRMGQAMRLLA
jgi:Sec-independent protein secretion pathway component TatC